jgi:uncharacterized membrane protein YkvA (DUF1232 family)
VSTHYSEEGFWSKLRNNAVAAGRQVVHKALTLYYTASAAETPLWAKTVIFGALGYFIFPMDAIPDAIPVLGFTDDLSVLLGAAATVAAHIRPEHTKRAEETLKQWFG